MTRVAPPMFLQQGLRWIGLGLFAVTCLDVWLRAAAENS